MHLTGVGVIAACSHAKTRAAADRLRARTLTPGLASARAREWLDRVQAAPGELPAYMMYCGVYWSGVMDLWRQASSRDSAVPLWILSAGYGLIPSDAVIAPYSATLSPREPDSVLARPGPLEALAWWRTLQAWSGPRTGAPRSLVDLVSAHPTTAWIVIAGGHYVHATAAELARLDTQGELRQRFVIVSPGLSGRASVPEYVDSVLLRADSRWEERLGRGKVSLGIRLARHLHQRAAGRADQLDAARRAMEAETESLTGLSHPEREPMTDDEVLAYLNDELSRVPDVPFTRALRQLRDAGRACEYKRFRALYHQVKESIHAQR